MPTPEFTMEQGTVVVGYDGSDEARAATLWAAGEANSRRRGLVIANVVGLPPFPESKALPGRGTMQPILGVEQKSVREGAENAVDGIARECRKRWPDLAVTTEVTSGRAAEALVRVAGDAELLVIGPSGLTGLPRMLLGSTAAALLHEHQGPVVVVRQAGDPAPAEGGRVVVGVDGSKLSADAIDFAFDFADRHGSELVAVHAWSDLPMDALAPVRTWDYDLGEVKEKGERLVAESLAGYQERYPGVATQRVVALDRPSHALLEHAEGASLLVVGSHGRGALRRALLGSVSHAMAYHAPCPVAVVRRA